MNKPRAESNWKEIVLMIKDAYDRSDMTQTEIQRKTGLIQSNISRIFNLKHPPLISTLVAIAEVVGVELIIKDKEVE